MNKNFVLLRTLLLSTSQWNIYKNCRDRKKRGRIIGNSIGLLVLYLMLMAYCVANCIGYGRMGLAESIPVLCALVISALAFFFTMFKTNGYLFAFKEYDMLMALPFRPKDFAAGKFLYMYVQSLPWYMSVSLAMMIVYRIYSGASAAVYPLWVILSLILPVIPMLAAAFAGFLIAKAGSGFRNKTMAQTVLVLIFVLICFASRFFLEDAIRGDKMNEVLETISDTTKRASGIYLPAGWFAGAVSRFEISGMLLLAGSSLALFELIFLFVGNSYRKINSALKSHAASGNFVMAEQKSRSLLQAIAFKEFRRMTGSVTYMTNALIGECLCLIAGIAVLFVDFDRMLAKILQDAPVTKEMLYPAIPLIIYFFIGIVATTAFTLSLEGKNYWIVQSLPISRKVLCQGKMLFNLYLTLPVTLFATVTFCISSGAPFLNTVLYLILGICLCAFSTAWGMVCGIKHMRLDWENEVEIIKQGAAVAVYLMPNMLGSMILIVGVVALGTVISQNLITLCLILLVLGLAVLSYRKVLSLCRE